MYLKKVEIQGFKSFGDKVDLQIPEGITIVVGPNGCGKSNIADAMRWVLGEQSARLLRGLKMEDVIFAGTQSRKGLGYAQVSMTIDNSQGELPLDYTEIVIMRRVYKSGESEYLINKSPCRLKDIQELLMGTGVGKEGYSIIGQGQIDSILSSKPEDRRNLFEEAAGIYKYKLKKLEAEKKLLKEKENLTRVQDILLELESRLEVLKEQAGKAEEYIGIKEALKIVEINIFLLEIDKIEKDILEFKQTYEEIKSEYESNTNTLEQVKLSYDKVRESLQGIQGLSTNVQVSIANMKANIEKYEGRITLNNEKIKAIEELNRRIKEDSEKKANKLAEQEIEKQILMTKEKELLKEIASEEKELNIFQEENEEICSMLDDEEKFLEDSKKEIYRLMTYIGDIKTSIEKGNTINQQIKIRKDKIANTLNVIKSDIMHQDVRLQVLRKEEADFVARHMDIATSISRVNKDLLELDNEKQQLYKNKINIENAYNKSNSRYTVLNQMKNEHEGYQKSVKNILSLKQKDPSKWEGIYGVIGEIISVPPTLETAIDTALGASIQHIVVKNEEIAKKTIEHIKKNNLGRATFLPLTSVKSYSMGPDKNSIINEIGVIGIGNELVQYDTVYGEVIANLLGRVIIIDNLENAVQFARKYKYRYKVVTLQGELLNPGGSITGGSFNKNKENIFSRSREVQELSDTINAYVKQLNSINNAQITIDNRYNTLKERKMTLEESLIAIEKKQTHNKIETNNVEMELRQTKLQQSELWSEEKELESELEKTFVNINDSKDLLNKSKLEIETINKQIVNKEETIQQIKITKESIISQITEFKVLLSSKREILKSTSEQILKVTNNIEDYDDENKGYENQFINNSHQKIELQKEIERLYADSERETAALRCKEDELLQIKENELVYLNDEKEKRQEQEQINEKNSLLQAEIYRMENKLTKSNMDRENLFQKIWEDYEVTYNLAKEFKADLGSIIQMRKMASEHKSKIRAMGNVNIGAVEEYNEITERYNFLRTHEQDILQAEETLRQLIIELTKSMEEIFSIQFQKIATNFNIVFTELFGGGQAFLQLTDKENLLESGIEIIAQPPGKKLQNMMLLSGGERALTAIALLFGILRMKPSPFAILDEIEAALDDANVARFAQYLKKIGSKMQFIVITHRKGTMEVADTMYGVTMEEQGISKVISVKLDEVQDYAKNKSGII